MEVETKIMSVLDIIIVICSIIATVAAVLEIIDFFMKRKGKALFPRLSFKAKLKSYKKISLNEEQENKKAKEIVSLLLKARKRFEDMGFVYDVRPTGDGNIIVKGLYKIHLTPPRGDHHQQFKISRVNNPIEAYYSEGYPAAQKENNDVSVLDDLINII